MSREWARKGDDHLLQERAEKQYGNVSQVARNGRKPDWEGKDMNYGFRRSKGSALTPLNPSETNDGAVINGKRRGGPVRKVFVIVFALLLVFSAFFSRAAASQVFGFASSHPSVRVSVASSTLKPGSRPQSTSSLAAATTASPSSGVYLGVTITGVPANMTPLTTFEQDAQKHVAIVNFWRDMGGSGSILYNFWLQNVFQHNSIPMITWVPENWDSGSDQTPYSLSKIAAGADDAIINSYANTLKSYGKPILLRFAHEMNGSWFRWGGQPQAYIAAWRHIHDIFVADGASNVQFVWCPNTQWSASSSFDPYYPGDSYVDWAALDSYNKPGNGSWLWFFKLFSTGNSYQDITTLTSKPLVIAGTSSAERVHGPPRRIYEAQWLTARCLRTAIPRCQN